MGIREILEEWTAFRLECVRRRIHFELKRKQDKLHLLKGLEKILLDIDQAIRIVRETEEEREVVPNLMIGFGIDEAQAEFVAEIRLRQLNREYILKRTDEIADLEKSIAEMQETLKSRSKLLGVIVAELKSVAKKYGQPRRSEIVYAAEEEEEEPLEETPDYPVNLFFTREGYFKKITPQSWRMSSEHKLKEGDAVIETFEATNRAHLLFFSDRGQVYKAQASDFEDTKASVLGDYIPAKLGFDEGESAVYLAVTADYSGYVVFGFENGKVAKVDLASYQTKTRRRKLTGAYSTKSPLVGIWAAPEDGVLLLAASNGRMLLLDTARISAKTVRDTIGVQVMNVKGKHTLASLVPYQEGRLQNPHRYTPRTIPSAGYQPQQEDIMEQTTLG